MPTSTRLAHALLTAALTAFPLAAQSRAALRPVWPDEGPMTWAPRPTTSAITAGDLRTRLYQIADDSMRGRKMGEPGNTKTTEYIAREFARLGLKPAGDDGTFFQTLPYGPLGFEMSAARLTVGAAVLAQSTEWIPIAPSAANGLRGTADLTDVPTVFAGRWGDTAVALDPALFRGKVAVFVNDAPNGGAGGRGASTLLSCADLPDKFGAAATIAAEAAARTNPRPAARPTFGGTTPARDPRAQAAGAVGVLLVSRDGISAAARAAILSPRQSLRPATIPGGDALMVGATITAAAAERIFSQRLEAQSIGAAGAAVSAHWTYGWAPSGSPSRNVIAILPGSDPTRAAEYVLVGAHNDHLGMSATPVDHDSLRAVNTVTRRQGANDTACQPTPEQQHRIDSLIARARSIRPARLDSVLNGADDDGSGTVVLLEIAERFAVEKPARSIIFVSHQGEEAGLLGSRWFVDHPTIPLANIVAAHNMDMVGKGRADQVIFGGPNSVQSLGSRRLSREFGDIIDSVSAASAEPMAIDRSWDVPANPLNRFCRSDQVNYVNKNVPVTYFSLGYAQDYHQVTDEPQYIEYDHTARLARFVHEVMLAIAMRADRPAIAGADPSYPSCGR